jgi:REP element-mobilizing transposase RayT
MTNHSYSTLYYHLVWATQDRNKLIKRDFKKPLYDYIGKIAVYKGFGLIAVGGIEDHIHLLIQTTAKSYIPKIVSSIKSNSSRFIRENFLLDFGWQNGYSVFTVDVLSLVRIKNYILNQETHHCEMDYEREYNLLLKRWLANKESPF